jgi:hypothetical protein
VFPAATIEVFEVALLATVLWFFGAYQPHNAALSASPGVLWCGVVFPVRFGFE